jgi:RNA polymerase sigma-B factor
VTTAQAPLNPAAGSPEAAEAVLDEGAPPAAEGAEVEAAESVAAPAAETPPVQQQRPPHQVRSSAHAAAHAEARELFRRMADLDPQDPARVQIRERLVRMHLPLVEHLARRFRNRGEPLDDLTQVATIGLIKSVDRFDPQRGVEFSTYATPTIIGEIKRHFRDKGWAVRVPRRLQELRLSLTAATSELSQRNGRSPTVAELAVQLGLT